MPFMLFLSQTIANGHGFLFSVSCSCHSGSNYNKWVWVALQCELLMSFWVKPVQMNMGCSLVCGLLKPFWSNNYKRAWVAHANLCQIITNGHGLLFSMSCSFHFGSNQFKWIQVALQCELLMPHQVKQDKMEMELLFSVGYSGHFRPDHYKKAWVALQCGLLFSVGCSCYFGSNHYKQHGLLFSVGCSCQYTLFFKDTEPTLIGGLLGLLIGCSVAFQ